MTPRERMEVSQRKSWHDLATRNTNEMSAHLDCHSFPLRYWLGHVPKYEVNFSCEDLRAHDRP